MWFVDTGYLIALSNERDGLHRRAATWARLIPPGGLLTTEFVLLELMNHRKAHVNRQALLEIVDLVRHHAGIEILALSADLMRTGEAIYRSHTDKAWSLTDCISFHVMRQRGLADALAYDQHFEQAGFRPLLRDDPPASP